jgi:hypothetical protein
VVERSLSMREAQGSIPCFSSLVFALSEINNYCLPGCAPICHYELMSVKPIPPIQNRNTKGVEQAF